MYNICSITDKKSGELACPLRKVSVSALIDSSIAEITMTQDFINNGNKNIEAIYTFPLPHNAQVTGFKVKIGRDEIKGEFKEKEEAFKEYDTAVRSGDSAFLLESHRPDIFQLSLGNIVKDEVVSIRITYMEETKIVDNELRWVLPSVVAPRYIPGKAYSNRTGPGTASPTDKVLDADFITPPMGDIQYTLGVNAAFRGMDGIRKVASPSHPVEISIVNGEFSVMLARETELLDSDFVLTALVDADVTDSVVMAVNDAGETFGKVRINVDLDDYVQEQKNYEYICMIDVSGSMAGEKLEQAKRALKISLRNLLEGDLFNIVAFESSYRSFSQKAVVYSQSNLESADRWISSLEERGGTEIYQPLSYVLKQSIPYSGLDKIVLLFTDGQVGNEREILNLVSRNNDSLYLYPFGIDTAVNKFFIDSLAEAGNGMPEYVYPGERIEDKVIRQFSRIHQPFIANSRIVGKDGKQIYTVPDMPKRLYGSDPYSFSMHLEKQYAFENITLCGEVGGEKFERALPVIDSGDFRLLSLKWAKEKIKLLEKQIGGGNARRDELIRKEIIELSQGFRLLSTLTSLVAIYKRIVKDSALPETIVVPVAKPRNWDMFDEPVDMKYCFAAPSRSAQRQARIFSVSEGDYRMFEPDEVGAIPTFLRKRSSSRTDKRSFIEEQSNVDFHVAENEEMLINATVPSGNGESLVNTTVPAGKEEIFESMRRASEKQNADGTFGSGRDGNLKTAFYIIGMLMNGEDWKPYRIQITKAGGALFNNGNDHILSKAIALYLLKEKKLFKGISFQLTIGNVISKLSGDEKEVYDAFKESEFELFYDYFGFALSKGNDHCNMIVNLLARV